jgi:hypothetical protein
MLLAVKAFHCRSMEIDFVNFNVDRDLRDGHTYLEIYASNLFLPFWYFLLNLV